MFIIQIVFWLCEFYVINANLFHYTKNDIQRLPAKLNAYKVDLTQLGYIQFLRYELNVPEINEFTYCIWIKSVNFTYPHPLLSYSLHEHDRLIRGWIDDHGTTINLAILEATAYVYPVRLKEYVWYHICQSWDTLTGYSSLHLNGKLLHSVYNQKVHRITVPAHGDIVVGQEYTDFDKGLEDGIEGSVYGFNMILESIYMRNHPKIGDIDSYLLKIKPIFNDLTSVSRLTPLRYNDPLSTTNKHFGSIYNNDDDFLSRLNALRRNHIINKPQITEMLTPPRIYRPYIRNTRMNITKILSRGRRYATSEPTILESLPLGVQLIEMSYKNCLKNRGGPLIGDKVLINWSLTTVRVFGGAILKPVRAACGDF